METLDWPIALVGAIATLLAPALAAYVKHRLHRESRK